eukprot:Skav204837  [mRNA]  locus=scaffold2524:118983:122505:- [translate_table: standard]
MRWGMPQPQSVASSGCKGQDPDTWNHQAGTGGYEVGGDDTQSCGYERERIDNAAECREAASALDKSFGYTGSYIGWPKDCFQYRSENVVSYEIGLPGLDCQQGSVVSTYTECASSEVISSVGISFSNWQQTHRLQFGCLYNSVLHSLFFNFYEGGEVDYDYAPVCKTETNPVIRHFDQGEFDTVECRHGHPIDDPELCREAARNFEEVFSTDGSYSGYPMGCFKFLNGDVYFNRHEGADHGMAGVSC